MQRDGDVTDQPTALDLAHQAAIAGFVVEWALHDGVDDLALDSVGVTPVAPAGGGR